MSVPKSCVYGFLGPNGAGKSTLLKAISGELEPNKGTVELGPGERLSVLDQDHFKYDEYTVMDTVLMGHQPLWENMKERELIYAKPEMTEEDGNRAAELEEKFAEMDGWNAESDAAQLLQNLGVKDPQHQKQMRWLFWGVPAIVLVLLLLPLITQIVPALNDALSQNFIIMWYFSIITFVRKP